MLEIRDLHAYYGAIEGLKGVDIQVADGSITCIIGSNGAGKTTLLKSISNVVARKGSITWNGQEITGMKPTRIAKLGITHVPEGRQVFPGLTVKENLETGTIGWHGFFGTGKYDEDLERVFELFPRLKERENQKGWSLSGGEQQMLAIGRALMARPSLLLLDEPSMGLAPLIIEEMFKKIVEINKASHLPVLLVEQNASLALEISDYAYVIEQGKISFHGKAADLRDDPRIVAAYLGQFANQEGA